MFQSCKKCGKCCYQEIPLTLLDLNKITKSLSTSIERVFKNYIQQSVSEKSGLFKIAKQDDGACIFLQNNVCSIHDTKPNVCRFYDCTTAKKSTPWISQYNDISKQSEIWEQSIAASITREYIRANNTRFIKQDFKNALTSIQKNIRTDKSQTIKLARDGSEQPICMIYDCSKCKEKGLHSSETLVTLLDMERIIPFLKIDWNTFFKKYVEKQVSQSGLFKLKRNPYCVFFHPKKHCGISNVKPLHCQFTPCPKKIKSPEEFDCYYLGDGALEQQFAHYIAILHTQQYTVIYQTTCKLDKIQTGLTRLHKSLQDKTLFKEFCRKIAKYRYVNDTLLYNSLN